MQPKGSLNSDYLAVSADLACGLLDFVAPRRQNMDAFRGFFEALEEDAFETRTQFIALVEENLERLIFIFDPAWIDESKRSDPDWQGCLDLFEKVAMKSAKWGAYVIAAVSYRCMAVIHSEYLGDRKSAFSALSRGEAALPAPCIC